MARNAQAAQRYVETEALMQRVRSARATKTCPVCLQPNTRSKGITCGSLRCSHVWLTGSPPEPTEEGEDTNHAGQ